MKLLLVIDELQSLAAGGTERQIFQLVEFAKADGIKVELAILRGTAWLTPEIAGVPVHFLNVDSWRSLSLRKFRGLVRLLRGFDVVQTFFVESNLVIPIVARLARVPLVIGSRRNLNYWIGSKTLRWQRFSNRFANVLVANSEAVKRVVAEQERMPPERIKVIYNAIDATHFAPDPVRRKTLREQLGFANDAVVVGHVGTLHPHKGVLRFVEVAISLVAQHPQARFMLIGGGPLEETLRAKVDEAGMQHRITLLGSRDDIPDLLNVLDIGALLSDTEGFSNAILEYMAKGLAIVATDVGGNAEALQGHGVLVPTEPAEAIVGQLGNLICDPVKRAALGEKARSRAISVYGMKEVQGQWRSLYALAQRG